MSHATRRLVALQRKKTRNETKLLGNAVPVECHLVAFGRHTHVRAHTHQGSKVPIPNRRLVPSSREKRGKTGKNGGKRGKTGKNGGKRRKNGGKRGENGGKTGKNGGNLGGGVFWTRPTHPNFTPPTFIILWGAFFANQIEAKA